jgi:FeS assembly SUF system protein
MADTPEIKKTETIDNEKPESPVDAASVNSEVKADGAELNSAVVEALKSVYDPEIPVNIFELGLIYSININDKGKVDIEMTLTSPACPVAGTLPPEVEGKIRSIPGVSDCSVKVVWEPTWGMHMMTEEAKLQLNLF